MNEAGLPRGFGWKGFAKQVEYFRIAIPSHAGKGLVRPMNVLPPSLENVTRPVSTALAVRLSGVTKTFGKQVAVDDLSLEVPEGSIYGFIGPNGSGKTTTIRMILHIFHPDSGAVEVLGERSTRSANDRIGYLPEERGLYKKQTVRRALGYFAALKGMGRALAKSEMERWLERMELTEHGDKKIESLSKGMAQKIQFVSAVIAKPRLLILDEPFSGLDPVNMEVIREAILDLRRQGTTVIFSTHDMGVAEKMCDRIFMIFKGRKVLDGDLKGIKAAYGTNVYHISGDGDLGFLDSLAGVEHVRDLGQVREVRYAGDSQVLLKELTSRVRVRHFEIASPSLHDIFVRIAGPQAAEVTHG
ncbi:MAG: ATP-binding cassette domain-containing protein [Verrucomicrobiae bacterium]|nr:ATP-binding cassette domain-containing protein [Verrucomicrobiae bacterium]